jgi:hypothetical protein
MQQQAIRVRDLVAQSTTTRCALQIIPNADACVACFFRRGAIDSVAEHTNVWRGSTTSTNAFNTIATAATPLSLSLSLSVLSARNIKHTATKIAKLLALIVHALGLLCLLLVGVVRILELGQRRQQRRQFTEVTLFHHSIGFIENQEADIGYRCHPWVALTNQSHNTISHCAMPMTCYHHVPRTWQKCSHNRPGVATMICGFLRNRRSCLSNEMPPTIGTTTTGENCAMA